MCGNVVHECINVRVLFGFLALEYDDQTDADVDLCVEVGGVRAFVVQVVYLVLSISCWILPLTPFRKHHHHRREMIGWPLLGSRVNEKENYITSFLSYLYEKKVMTSNFFLLNYDSD